MTFVLALALGGAAHWRWCRERGELPLVQQSVPGRGADQFGDVDLADHQRVRFLASPSDDGGQALHQLHVAGDGQGADLVSGQGKAVDGQGEAVKKRSRKGCEKSQGKAVKTGSRKGSVIRPWHCREMQCDTAVALQGTTASPHHNPEDLCFLRPLDAQVPRLDLLVDLMPARKGRCLSHEGGGNTQGRSSVTATKAAGAQSKGSVSATKAVGAQSKGSVLPQRSPRLSLARPA